MGLFKPLPFFLNTRVEFSEVKLKYVNMPETEFVILYNGISERWIP